LTIENKFPDSHPRTPGKNCFARKNFIFKKEKRKKEKKKKKERKRIKFLA
jgi:hypothetical protein